MGFQSSGLDKLKLQVKRMAQVPQVANEELRKCADEIAATARNMAPIDYGDLRAAIQVGRRGVQGQGGRFVAGLSQYEVFINDRQPVRDPKKKETQVGEYAWEVHEHMGWAGRQMELMPSKKSVLAGSIAGVIAGGKFLDRAVEAHRISTSQRLAQVVSKYIASLDK